MKFSVTTGSIVTGILAAFMTSLCCITPLLAVLAGAVGFASTFSWLMPYKTYLIGISVLSISFAWYQKLKSVRSAKCTCDNKEGFSFFKSRKFLGIITVFAGLMISFSSYSSMFYPSKSSTDPPNAESIQLFVQVEGMSCAGCEGLIEHEVSKLKDVQSVQASFKNSNVLVEHSSTVSVEEIITSIESLGYSAKMMENKNKK